MTSEQTNPGTPLERVEFVLNRPRMGGNVGAAARAARNMGLGGLRLVALEDEVLPEARMLAAGAIDTLQDALLFDTLKDALAGAQIVLGTSRRVKSSRTRIMTPREAVSHVLDNLGGGRALFVFGPEDTGLTREEIALCDGIISIPADERYPSLNLAQAVMVMAYELRMAAMKPLSSGPAGGPSREEREEMFAQLMAVLDMSGFFIWNPREKVTLHMREILAKGVRTSQEARIMRGAFRRIAWALSGKGEMEEPEREGEP